MALVVLPGVEFALLERRLMRSRFDGKCWWPACEIFLDYPGKMTHDDRIPSRDSNSLLAAFTSDALAFQRSFRWRNESDSLNGRKQYSTRPMGDMPVILAKEWTAC